ncbi:MAG: methyl-accepting chemotaxis protein [Gammaproteobacteria bacterium]|nr:methyl-accepting chemotaxis protein [Gammaproteobacteria bacterium]
MLLIIIFSIVTLIQNIKAFDSSGHVAELTSVGISASKLVHELQKERGLTAGYLGSNGTKILNQLKQQRQVTDAALVDYKISIANYPADYKNANFISKTSQIANSLNLLAQRRLQISSLEISLNDALSYYTSQNSIMLNFFELIIKAGNSLDIVNRAAAYVYFLQSKERSGVERAVISAVFAQDKFTGNIKFRFITLLSEQNIYLKNFTNFARKEQKALYNSTVKGPAIDKVDQFRQLVLSKDSGFGVEPALWFKMATERINLLKIVEDKLAQDLQQTALNDHSLAQKHLIELVIGCLVTFAVSIYLASVIINSIINQLSNLNNAMVNIEKNADLTVRAEQQSEDELGLVALSFNNMLNNLLLLVTSVRSATGQLTDSISCVQSESDTVRSEINNGMQQIEMVATAVNEMESSIADVARNSLEASTLTKDSTQSVVQGKALAQDAQNAMAALVEKINQSMDVISNLARDSEQIGSVLDVIKGVAEQTNLLALNAAIEAARAGEQGRGFAVVADEVRNLAKQTQDSTQQINAVIEKLQNDTCNAVVIMEESQKYALSVVEEFGQVTQLFEMISDQSIKINEMNTHTAVATEQQHNTVNEINRNVSDIQASYQQSSISVENLNLANNSLKLVADDMNTNIGHFKV